MIEKERKKEKKDFIGIGTGSNFLRRKSRKNGRRIGEDCLEEIGEFEEEMKKELERREASPYKAVIIYFPSSGKKRNSCPAPEIECGWNFRK